MGFCNLVYNTLIFELFPYFFLLKAPQEIFYTYNLTKEVTNEYILSEGSVGNDLLSERAANEKCQCAYRFW